MNVVQATKRHIDLLVPLFDGYRQFYKQRRDLKAAKSFLIQRLRRKDSLIFLALEGPGKPCGFVQLYPSFSSVSLRRLWILNDLFVLPSARRKGAARALIERSVRMAKKSKAKGLVLETEVLNLPAQNLYQRLGWKKEDEFHQYFFNV